MDIDADKAPSGGKKRHSNKKRVGKRRRGKASIVFLTYKERQNRKKRKS